MSGKICRLTAHGALLLLALGTALSSHADGFALQAPAGGLRWGIDILTFEENGTCTGDFNPAPLGPHLTRTSLGVAAGGSRSVGVVYFPPTVRCVSGRYELLTPAPLRWEDVTPGDYSFQIFEPDFIRGGILLIGDPVPTSVRFEHSIHMPEIGAAATVTDQTDWNPTCSRTARYADPLYSAIAPPPGMASPQYIEVASTCSQSALAAVSLPIPLTDGTLWTHDLASGAGWRSIASTDTYTTYVGNTAIVPIYGGSGLIAFSYVRSSALPLASPQPDLWWGGDAESGWGLSIAASGDKLFVLAYVYDDSGKPSWIVVPSMQWDAGKSAWTGDVYRPRGTPYTRYDASSLAMGSPVGNASLSFADATDGTFKYLIDGFGNSRSISRFVFGANNGASGTYSGIWWGGVAQNGWGISLAQQDETIFAIWYTYNTDGTPTWLYGTAGKTSTGKYSGVLYQTIGGPWLPVPSYNGALTRSAVVGNLDFAFNGTDAGTLTTVVNGTRIVNAIQRYSF